jgi:hypothetical protein
MSGNILDDVLKSLSPKEDGEPPKAPAHIGKAHFEDDLRMIGSLGVKGFDNLFGKKIADKNDGCSMPVNFGSKKDVGGLPDEVRLRLFNLKKLVSNAEIQAQYKFHTPYPTPDQIMDTDCYKFHLAPVLKAYNVTDFTAWIPSVNARFYFEEYEIPHVLADQFDTMPMDSATIDVPGDIGLLEGVEETDVATFTSQSTTSSSYQVISRNNVTHTQITQDLISDSAPKYIDKLRKDTVKGCARAFDKAIINGDTTGSPRGASHQDSDIAALALNATFSKAFNGLRKKAFANSANSSLYDHGGDSPSKVMFEKTLKLMGKMASEKDDLCWLVPPTVETALVTGAIPELFTAFAFGGLASNVTGQVPPVFGVKVVTSQYAREDLNASGVYAAASTLTNVLLFKKSRFSNFVRQAIRVWAAPSLPSSDIMLMTAKCRHAWAGNNQSAAEKSVVMAYNVATL